jgi:hypothetical protein
MRYHVTGAHRESAQDMSCVIDARTAEEAESLANRRGMLISQIVRTEETPDSQTAPPPPPLEQWLASGESIYTEVLDEVREIKSQMADLAHRLAEKKALLAQLARRLGKGAADAAPTPAARSPEEVDTPYQLPPTLPASGGSLPARSAQTTG